jgi:hypothetical protein
VLEDAEEEGGDSNPAVLACNASLYIVAWPEEFAITLSLQPSDGQTWQDDTTSISLTLGKWTTQQSFTSPWSSDETKEVTLTCNVVGSSSITSSLQEAISFQVTNKSNPSEAFDVSHDVHFSCFVVDIKNPTRTFPVGYTDIRDADILNVQIENTSNDNVYIPTMFYMRGPANVTGCVPMIWILDEETDEYVPSGIPVQTSKYFESDEFVCR